MADGTSLVKLLFEAIPSSHFIQEPLQRSHFVVNSEKTIWKPQEVVTELGIVLDLRKKMFHINKTRIKSILHALHDLTSATYVTAKKNGTKNW